MTTHPKTIEEILCDLAEQYDRILDLREDMRNVELSVLAGVLTETIEGGKPAFSNDKARDIALTARLLTDKQYQAWKLELRELETERQVKLARIERLRAEWALYLVEQKQLVTA